MKITTPTQLSALLPYFSSKLFKKYTFGPLLVYFVEPIELLKKTYGQENSQGVNHLYWWYDWYEVDRKRL